MNFYILTQDLEEEGVASVDSLPEEVDAGDLLLGKLIDYNPDEVPILDLHPQSGEFRGDIMKGVATLFHDDLIEDLNNFGFEDVQYFPVGLKDVDGELEGGYSIANILSRIKAVDLDNSEYILDTFGNPDHLKCFTIDEAATKGQPLFLLEENPTMIIINEELKDYLSDDLVGLSVVNTKFYKYRRK